MIAVKHKSGIVDIRVTLEEFEIIREGVQCRLHGSWKGTMKFRTLLEINDVLKVLESISIP